MNFKITYDDFKLLSKYMETKAKGSDLDITITGNYSRMDVKVTNDLSEEVTINIFPSEIQMYPKILRKRNLGDEL